ncbi:uncharacterized protein DUF3298 [Pontibacter mucosus]|uniref:Uncharacterized protein DUF3298 n=2 Tax=Pontibacter mucosus TaxID=1649266 RepID=A0A2T5YKX7_9BACT|nr:uncharacterized protein DUF3298 [Pontibacter mucosus]
MLYFKNIGFTLAILCLASCSQLTDKNPDTALAAAQEAPLQFETQSMERSSTGCATDSSTCAKVSITYPEAVGGETALRDSINLFVQQRLRKLALDFNPDASIAGGKNASEFLATFFLGQHEQLTKDFADSAEMPASVARWELEVKGEPLLNSGKATSLQLQVYYYTGGAHPNYYRVLQSFGPNGEKLAISDMVTDTLALMQLAEQEFRKVKEVVGDKPLAEAGLFIEGDLLPLPQNVALTPDGLLLYYNPYEIGPWALGDTEVLLRYEQLAPLLHPKYKP